MAELDVNNEIVLGVKSPEIVFAEMDSLVEVNLEPTDDLSTVQYFELAQSLYYDIR